MQLTDKQLERMADVLLGAAAATLATAISLLSLAMRDDDPKLIGLRDAHYKLVTARGRRQ